MRQRLQFESAWDKTITTRDREKIKKAFHRQLPQLNDGIHFSYLWKAKNHHDDLLITVLIHNRTKSILHLKNTSISYTEHEQMTVTGHFDVPCDIGAYTTMPWTFIFTDKSNTQCTPDYQIDNL